jgi:hypothetical protein
MFSKAPYCVYVRQPWEVCHKLLFHIDGPFIGAVPECWIIAINSAVSLDGWRNQISEKEQKLKFVDRHESVILPSISQCIGPIDVPPSSKSIIPARRCQMFKLRKVAYVCSHLHRSLERLPLMQLPELWKLPEM